MSADDVRSIAIVGIGCRFPGGVSGPEQFWSMLRDGRQGVGDIPDDRFDLKRFYDAAPQTPGKTTSRYGGYLRDIDQFDAAFFGVSPRDAERIDPQQRLLLETAWEALENAGADVAALERSRVAVFIGQWLADFEQRLSLHPEEMDFSMTLGSGRYAASGRIAYAFDFAGPSITLDTACSSSLSAVHLAVQSLRSGEASLALAGGVNVILAPHIHIAYSQSGMMAPDGRCKFGDARADGYVRSEGAAILVLKPLGAARRDGDRIHAVIRGSAVNNDGRSSGSMGTPSLVGQEGLLRRALEDAGVDPLSVGYVEAHGTGTRAGDKVEIGALAAALGQGRSEAAPLLVGSVKTNLGHTEGAAGAAGLIKAVLAVREGVVPPSLNLETLNPEIPWDAAPVVVPRAVSPWPTAGAPRRAGVSAFGISGANAHVVVEEPPLPPPSSEAAPPLPILTLSARSAAALRALAGEVAARLEGADGPELADLVAFSQTRRTALSQRAAFLAEDPAALRETLMVYAAGGDALAEGLSDPRRPAKAALVFPGQGGQYAGMARGLLASEPVFRASLERSDAVIRAEAGWSLLDQLALDADDAGFLGERIDVVQPALAAISIAYADWLKANGLAVEAVVGHSMGEAAAACVAGAITLEDAMRILCGRSALMRQMSGRGAMALVDLPQADVAAALGGYEGRVSIAAVNSPRASVISGDQDAVAELVARFGEQGVFSRLVKVDVASHSPHMDGPAAALRTALEGLSPRAEEMAFISAVLGRTASGAELDADYWARNLREPVRFADAVAELSRRGVTVFVEAGPHPVLAPSIEQTIQGDELPTTVICCGRRDTPERVALLATLARLWCAGARVDWARPGAPPARVVDFPTYPWRRRRFWVEAAELARTAPGVGVRRGPDEEARGWLHQIVWRDLEAAVGAAPSDGRWLALGEADALADALVAAGAEVERAPLMELEARLAGLGAHAHSVNVLIAAPDDAEAAFLPLRAAQSLPKGAAVRLWFLTRGAQAPQGPTRLNIDHAALWGAARVLSDERPDLWGGLLDLPAQGEPASAARGAAWLLAPDGEDQIAVRDGQAFAPRLVVAPDAPGAAVQWRADGAYLITGGLGDVGLAVARAMVEDGARRLVLVGRTGLPPRRAWAGLDPASVVGRRVAAVRALEAMGASVQVFAVDVSDEAAVSGFLADYAAEGWPPILGLVHLAAVLDRRLIGETTRESFAAALSAKLRSAQILDRLLPDLQVFVSFSSLSSFLPQSGMAAYVAANLGLEALAADRRARGLAASCIAWGGWRDAGLIAGEGGAANMDELAQQGVGSFAPERGAALFAWAAGREAANIAVTPIDWDRYATARAGRREPLLKEVKGAAQGGGLADQLAGAEPGERRAILARIVVDAVARTLQLAPHEVDPLKEFGAMGLTSLLAMELRNRLERTLSRPLPATLAWNYPTVSALSANLAGETEPARADEPAAAATIAPNVNARIAAIADLSDGDALAALRRPRRGGA